MVLEFIWQVRSGDSLYVPPQRFATTQVTSHPQPASPPTPLLSACFLLPPPPCLSIRPSHRFLVVQASEKAIGETKP